MASAPPGTSERTRYEEKPLRVHRVRRVPLEDLHPHESVNPPDLESFCQSLKGMGVFYKAVLVDRESHTILDGTHRWAGLRKLGAPESPCIELDYRGKDEIRVFTWLPYSRRPPETFLDWMTRRNVAYEEQSRGRLEVEPGSVGMVGGGSGYRIREDPLPFFHRLEEDWSFEYVQSAEQLHGLTDREGTGFLRSPLSKRRVIEIARSEGHVPPKYTRHTFPYKFQHLMVPLDELLA